MLKKDITFTDFDGNTVTETHYFNMSTADLIEFDSRFPGGLESMVSTFVDSNDGVAILNAVKELILASHGEKSEDGRRFIKSFCDKDDFSESLAFEAMLNEMLTYPENFVGFVNAITPKMPTHQNTAPKLSLV